MALRMALGEPLAHEAIDAGASIFTSDVPMLCWCTPLIWRSKAPKDIEHQVNFEAEALGLERQHDGTGPHNVDRHDST